MSDSAPNHARIPILYVILGVLLVISIVPMYFYSAEVERINERRLKSDEMMLQKLEYTHYNSVRRGYVDEPVHWRYSSARNYAGMPGLIDVITDWR